MFKYEVTRMFDDERWDNPGLPIAEIIGWMRNNDIPHEAVVRYAGCGTHMIEFAWEAREGAELNREIANRIEAEEREVIRQREMRDKNLV